MYFDIHMRDVVYVHAYTTDPGIFLKLRDIFNAFGEISIDGLVGLRAIFSRTQLASASENYGEELRQELFKYDFHGLGMWTEWADEKSIDEFYGSDAHMQFAEYARTTLDDNTWYRVVQSRNGNISTREVRRV